MKDNRHGCQDQTAFPISVLVDLYDIRSDCAPYLAIKLDYQAGLRAVSPTQWTSAASQQETFIFRAQTDRAGQKTSHLTGEIFDKVKSSSIKAEGLLEDLAWFCLIQSCFRFVSDFLRVPTSWSLLSHALVRRHQSHPIPSSQTAKYTPKFSGRGLVFLVCISSLLNSQALSCELLEYIHEHLYFEVHILSKFYCSC